MVVAFTLVPTGTHLPADRRSFSTKAGLPAGPYGPLNGALAPRSTDRTLEQRDVCNYTDVFCPGLCDTTDRCEQKIGKKSFSSSRLFLFWFLFADCKRLYADITFRAIGGRGVRGAKRQWRRQGRRNDRRSTPPGDAEIDADGQAHGIAIKKKR